MTYSAVHRRGLTQCVAINIWFRFRELDKDHDGAVERRDFIEALSLALKGDGGRGEISPGFTLGALVTEDEANGMVDCLEKGKDGRVSWEVSS